MRTVRRALVRPHLPFETPLRIKAKLFAINGGEGGIRNYWQLTNRIVRNGCRVRNMSLQIRDTADFVYQSHIGSPSVSP